MSFKKICRISNLEDALQEKLSKNGIATCKDVLSQDVLSLLSICESYNKAKILLKIVSEVVTPKSALQLFYKSKNYFLPTSLLKLDHVLHGGLTAGTITEITGPPGCGKTQFCMMLSTISAMNDTNNHVVYIDTENAFTGKRFLEIVENKTSEFHSSDVSSNVIVFQESTCKSLMNRLEMLEEIIISDNVKLIILDSIASLARKEFGHETVLTDRNQLLMKQAVILKYYAESFNIPVLVTNQITTKFNLDFIGETTMTAALGNTWAHAVNSRFMVKFLDPKVRQLTIAKSPIAPVCNFNFIIDKGGIHLIDD